MGGLHLPYVDFQWTPFPAYPLPHLPRCLQLLIPEYTLNSEVRIGELVSYCYCNKLAYIEWLKQIYSHTALELRNLN